MKVLDQVLQATARCLARYEAHTAGAPILAAVSGGIDSSVLALVLARLRERRAATLPVVVGHVDHGVHRDSAAAAARVATFCRSLGLPCVSQRLDGLRTDEAALRDARYAALCRMARDAGARVILTAHHADDDMETVLFRMMRGTGPRGLAGIPECRTLADGTALVRPFLQLRRSTLELIAAAHGVEAVEDPTNLDLAYSRNELRHELIPALRAVLGHKLDVSLIALARTARATTDVLDAQASRILRERACFPTAWRCELDLRGTTAADRPFLEEALQQIHARLHPDRRRPPFAFVVRVLELLQRAAGERVGGRRSLLVERTREGLLLLDPDAAGAPPAAPIEADVDTGVAFGATEWCITRTRHRQPPLSPSPGEAGRRRALLCALHTTEPWRLRTRRSGDRFWPLGAPAPVELRRFMQSRHVARFDRDRLPLLVDAKDEILWVPGVEIAHPHRILLGSRACFEIKLSILGGAGESAASY
jgi:tRNA(Ile)-lysidine synthase